MRKGRWRSRTPFAYGDGGARSPARKDMLYSTRRIVDAIFYVLRNGVTWWALPLDFPPWQTVY